MIWPWTKLDKPRALPVRCFSKKGDFTWEDWREQNKSKYPVRYWLQETLPAFLRSKWHKVGHTWYWVRTHTYNRYHILDLRCPGYGIDYAWGWLERSEAVMAAPFQVLKNFVEKELGKDDKVYDDSPDWSEAIKEIRYLYKWWTIDRIAAYDKANEMLNKDSQDKNAWMAECERLELQDDENLARLIKVRHFMWT